MSQVITNYAVSAAYPSTVGGTGTASKYFPAVPGPSIGVARTTPSASNSRGQLNVPGNSRLDGQNFSVDIAGSIFVDPSIACPTTVITLYAQTNFQNDGHNPLYTSIAASGNLTSSQANSAEPFMFHVDLTADSRTGVLQGRQSVVFSNVIVADNIVITNQINGINMAADVPFGLVLGIAFSVSGAANAAYLTQFAVSAV